MLTGLVYAAVVIMWAVVLVPQWLRRHDRDSARRTTLTFHRAMATLERRRSGKFASVASHKAAANVAGSSSRIHDRIRVTKASQGSAAIDRHLELGVDPFAGTEQEDYLRDARLARSRMVAREAAARRRKQVRQLLIGMSVVAVVFYTMGVVPLSLSLLPPFGLAAFWLAVRFNQGRPDQGGSADVSTAARASRRQASRASGGRRRGGLAAEGFAADGSNTLKSRSSKSRSSSANRDRKDVGRRRRYLEPASVPAYSDSEERFGSLGDSDSDVRLLSDHEVAVLKDSNDSELWDAVESPLPRYMTAANAKGPRRSRRREDWTAERMLEQVEALRNPIADDEAELGLDEYVDIPPAYSDERHYEHRRAVNS